MLAPVLALLLVFGVYPKLLTDAIDPAAERVIRRVAPTQETVDVGDVDLAVGAAEGAAP